MGVVLGTAVVVTKKPNGLRSSLNSSTRDLCWVAKRTRNFSHENTWQKTQSKALLFCISLANKRLLDVTRLASSSVQI